jgi:hypothetical protein
MCQDRRFRDSQVLKDCWQELPPTVIMGCLLIPYGDHCLVQASLMKCRHFRYSCLLESRTYCQFPFHDGWDLVGAADGNFRIFVVHGYSRTGVLGFRSVRTTAGAVSASGL